MSTLEVDSKRLAGLMGGMGIDSLVLLPNWVRGPITYNGMSLDESVLYPPATIGQTNSDGEGVRHFPDARPLPMIEDDMPGIIAATLGEFSKLQEIGIHVQPTEFHADTQSEAPQITVYTPSPDETIDQFISGWQWEQAKPKPGNQEHAAAIAASLISYYRNVLKTSPPYFLGSIADIASYGVNAQGQAVLLNTDPMLLDGRGATARRNLEAQVVILEQWVTQLQPEDANVAGVLRAELQSLSMDLQDTDGPLVRSYITPPSPDSISILALYESAKGQLTLNNPQFVARVQKAIDAGASQEEAVARELDRGMRRGLIALAAKNLLCYQRPNVWKREVPSFALMGLLTALFPPVGALSYAAVSGAQLFSEHDAHVEAGRRWEPLKRRWSLLPGMIQPDRFIWTAFRALRPGLIRVRPSTETSTDAMPAAEFDAARQ